MLILRFFTMHKFLLIFISVLAFIGMAFAPQADTATVSAQKSQLPTPVPALKAPALYTYQVVATYPHDPKAFTQGLVWDNGVLYESTGLKGQSSLRRVDLKTGRVLQRRVVNSRYFAEGLALLNNQLIQLTWQEKTGFVYDRRTFRQVRTFRYETEGWGLTHDGKQLIMSDGSATLRYLDPKTFAVVRTITVNENGRPISQLNELEYVKGEIFANVWQTNLVAQIDPATGRVVGWIDLSTLLSESERAKTDVLNGIAYDPKGDRLFVTGKLLSLIHI